MRIKYDDPAAYHDETGGGTAQENAKVQTFTG
jgi:hypothetical protein